MHRILGLCFAALLLVLAIPALADKDLALHRPVTDNSTVDLTSNSLCVDGDSTTAYQSGRLVPVWVEIDLGADFPVSLVRLIPSMHPDGLMALAIFGRTSSGTSSLLSGWAGTAHEGIAINVPIVNRVPVRYVQVLASASCAPVSWYSIQCLGPTGTTRAEGPTWGRLKARYK